LFMSLVTLLWPEGPGYTWRLSVSAWVPDYSVSTELDVLKGTKLEYWSSGVLE
jgi:hypothetical protein